MRCIICNREETYKTQFGYLCKEHLIELLEKKFFSEFRKHLFFERNSKVYINFRDEKNPRTLFSKIIIEEFQKKYPFEIINNKSEADYIIELDFLEDIAISYFRYLFFNDNKKCIKEGKIIRPFFIYSLRDVQKYLEIKKIKYEDFRKEYDEKDIDILNFLDKILEKKSYMPLINSIIKLCHIENMQ